MIVGRHPDHRRHQLLARGQLVEKGVAHGFISLARGLAASRSPITAWSTLSAEPALSSTGPHCQPSRYASMSVDPSFIAYASIATWKRSGSMRFTSSVPSQALTWDGMCFQYMTW